MRKRYSKKVREDAALICAIAASSGDIGWYTYDTGEQIDAVAGAAELAAEAWNFVRVNDGDRFLDMLTEAARIRDAEAEALIRTGWTP
ncbi:MAG TPA: hypothetical protein VJU58_13825 [Microbacterium sp.]|nr:hypothetical protein [Microbacterium sp.]